jgi:sugar/nucleoside kinase (ribokinase family)
MLDRTIFRGSRLCIVGSICRDVKIAPIHADVGLLSDGETPTDRIVETLGGGGANSALFAASLGAETRFAGKVSDDSLGVALERAMLDRGIACFLRRDPAVQTGSSLALSYDTHGQWTVAPSVPVEHHVNATGSGDLLSVCMMLLHGHAEIPIGERLSFANGIVADYIEGKSDLRPTLG